MPPLLKSIGKQTVGIERLGGGDDPLGAGGGAALAALVDRQLQRIDQVPTSSRAVTCEGFGRWPRVSSLMSSSAVSPRGKNSR